MKVKLGSGIKRFFTKIGGWIKKHKVLSVIILLAVIGIIFFAVKSAGKKEEIPIVDNTEVLTRQTISNIVSTSGKIVSADSRQIILQDLAKYDVSTIDVSLGDVVNEGDLLCTIDTTELQKEYDNAKQNQQTASMKNGNGVDQSDRHLYDTQLDAVNGTNRLIEAVDKANAELSTRKGELAEAERVYDEILRIYDDKYSEDEYYSLLEEQANGDDSHASRLADLSQMKGSIEGAKSSVDAAIKSVQAAEEAVEKAKQNLDDSYRDTVIGVEDALDTNAETKSGAVNGTYDIDKTVETLGKALEDATVKAPMSGTVTAINYKAGDTYAGDTLITIEDASSYKIEASVDEYDIYKVKPGQKVLFKTNATGTEELEAVVTEVAPRATTAAAASGSTSSSSVASYKVVMDVISKNENLRLDMSVKLNITVEEVQDVFAVSYEAIQTDEEGKTFIEVEEGSADISGMAMAGAEGADAQPEDADAENTDMSAASVGVAAGADNGAAEIPTKKIYVTTGMEGDYYTEISSPELEEGMIVRIPANDMATDIDALLEMSNGGM